FEKLTVELSGGNASGGQVNFALDPQAVNKDSWPDMRRLAIENSQFTIGGTTFNINNLNIDIQTRIKELVRSTIHEFTEAFKQLYNALGVQQHNILFGDDYCQLHGQPIAKWFLDLVSELH